MFRNGLMEGVSGLLLLESFIIEIPVLNTNSVEPDQTARFAASDLGLHVLFANVLKCDVRHKLVYVLL